MLIVSEVLNTNDPLNMQEARSIYNAWHSCEATINSCKAHS